MTRIDVRESITFVVAQLESYSEFESTSTAAEQRTDASGPPKRFVTSQSLDESRPSVLGWATAFEEQTVRHSSSPNAVDQHTGPGLIRGRSLKDPAPDRGWQTRTPVCSVLCACAFCFGSAAGSLGVGGVSFGSCVVHVWSAHDILRCLRLTRTNLTGRTKGEIGQEFTILP